MFAVVKFTILSVTLNMKIIHLNKKAELFQSRFEFLSPHPPSCTFYAVMSTVAKCQSFTRTYKHQLEALEKISQQFILQARFACPLYSKFDSQYAKYLIQTLKTGNSFDVSSNTGILQFQSPGNRNELSILM